MEINQPRRVTSRAATFFTALHLFCANPRRRQSFWDAARAFSFFWGRKSNLGVELPPKNSAQQKIPAKFFLFSRREKIICCAPALRNAGVAATHRRMNVACEESWALRIASRPRWVAGRKLLVPLRRPVEMDLERLIRIGDVVPAAKRFPAIRDDLNEHTPRRRVRNMRHPFVPRLYVQL